MGDGLVVKQLRPWSACMQRKVMVHTHISTRVRCSMRQDFAQAAYMPAWGQATSTQCAALPRQAWLPVGEVKARTGISALACSFVRVDEMEGPATFKTFSSPLSSS